jgi:hypothetical protein
MKNLRNLENILKDGSVIRIFIKARDKKMLIQVINTKKK